MTLKYSHFKAEIHFATCHKVKLEKLGKIVLPLNYDSFLHVWDNYIWIVYVDCWCQATYGYYISEVQKGVKTLKILDTFSVILLIHPFCYCIALTAWRGLLLNVHQTRCAVITILMFISSLWSSFDLRNNRYIFLEGEIHMLFWLSYPSFPISAPVMGDICISPSTKYR